MAFLIRNASQENGVNRPYITASIISGCSCCVHPHTASATAKGMTAEQHAELLSIVMLVAKTNQLATGLQVPLDPVFDKG